MRKIRFFKGEVMSERWCPECETDYRTDICPTCGYIDPDDIDDAEDLSIDAAGVESED